MVLINIFSLYDYYIVALEMPVYNLEVTDLVDFQKWTSIMKIHVLQMNYMVEVVLFSLLVFTS